MSPDIFQSQGNIGQSCKMQAEGKKEKYMLGMK